MLNNIFPWVKRNYEKLILGILLVLLIMTGLRLFLGGAMKKELEAFKKEIALPPTPPVKMPSVYGENLESYLVERPLSYYQPISDRAIFFPVPEKPVGPSQPEMNLECTGVSSTEEEGVFIATLRNYQTGKIYKARVGEQVEDLTVVSINRDVVVLSKEDKQYRLKPPTVPMSFKLTGIMPTETGSEAMLQNANTKKTYFVKKGDKVEDWEVLSISQDTVIISRPDAGKYELKSGGEFQRIQE